MKSWSKHFLFPLVRATKSVSSIHPFKYTHLSPKNSLLDSPTALPLQFISVWNMTLIRPCETNRRARLPLCSYIQSHIGRQLRLLRTQLTRTSRLPLRSLNLDPQDVSLQLQHFATQ
jgi:hypothetical protein